MIYKDVYDDKGRHVVRIWSDDPKDPSSWRNEKGRLVARIWGDDPKNQGSWRATEEK